MTKRSSLTQRAVHLANQTSDAYSFDRYNSWSAVAYALLKAGYDERQAEAIMRSKWTRWAADASGQRYGRVNARVVVEFAKKQGIEEVNKLTEETFQ